jgi:hypothetical protein
MEVAFSKHALEEMEADGISPADVRWVVTHGEVIQEYPDDRPFPSALLLGVVGGHPVHVVVARRLTDTLVVTCYRPDPTLWEETFKRKRS